MIKKPSEIIYMLKGVLASDGDLPVCFDYVSRSTVEGVFRDQDIDEPTEAQVTETLTKVDDYLTTQWDADGEDVLWAEVNGIAERLHNELYPTPASCPPSFIPCTVTYEPGGIVEVKLDGGVGFILQTDYDQAAFAVSCGVVAAPEGWDGTPSTLPVDWHDRMDDIQWCSDEYLSVAYEEETK